MQLVYHIMTLCMVYMAHCSRFGPKHQSLGRATCSFHAQIRTYGITIQIYLHRSNVNIEGI